MKKSSQLYKSSGLRPVGTPSLYAALSEVDRVLLPELPFRKELRQARNKRKAALRGVR